MHSIGTHGVYGKRLHSRGTGPAARRRKYSNAGRLGSILGNDFRGRVHFTRSFHRPTGLTLDTEIRLVIDAVDCFGEVAINNHAIGSMRGDEGRRHFKIGRLLDLRNQLSVIVECPRVTASSPPLPRPPGREGQPGGLIGEVRLEIDE